MNYGKLDIRNCDCMQLMREFPDGHFNLAIVDPPYGIGVNHNMGRRNGDKHSNYKKIKWDDESPTEAYFNELNRISLNQIIFGANHFISRLSLDSPCWIVWYKMFSEDVTFASVELAWTSFKKTSKHFQLSSKQVGRIHPTQKPVELYNWLLRMFSEPGQRILDTHMGSGSIAIACHYFGADLTACELDKDYYEAAMARIARETRQEAFL